MKDAHSKQNAPDADLSGRQLADYRLLRRLGRGAMAEVYLAEQLSLSRNVALKLLKPELATDQSYVRRFKMEARAAASLVHANIVQTYEVGAADGVHFIAQEYVAGQNLAELLARSGPPDLPAALAIMRQVATALAKAAAQGIVHRDIKPENLMVSSSGEVKVADFGLARIIHTPEQLKITQVGMTMGSPLYMSPEQIEGKPLDPRSDIYSLGVSCYQLLAGKPPFQGDTALNVAVQHLKATPERLENLRPDLPPGLCRIVHTMLSKDPQDRYANGAEVLRALRGLNVEGFADAWPAELDHFNTAEMVALSGARSAATQQLATVMAREDRARPLYRQVWLWAAVALAFVFGSVLAWPRPQPSLLQDDNEPRQEIPRMASAEEQYRSAMLLGSEAGWLSVLDYYAADEYHYRLAQKQLAELYLTQDRFYEARQLFDEFTRLGDAEQDYLAYGLAGQYVVLSLTEDGDAAAKKFVEFWPNRSRLANFDPTMARRAFSLARKNQQLADREKRREIDDWLERHLSDPDSDDVGG